MFGKTCLGGKPFSQTTVSLGIATSLPSCAKNIGLFKSPSPKGHGEVVVMPIQAGYTCSPAAWGSGRRQRSRLESTVPSFDFSLCLHHVLSTFDVASLEV